MEIVKLIGADVLPDDQKLVLEIAAVIRVGFLQQNAFHKVDTYVPMEKQYRMMKTILHLYDRSSELVSFGCPVSEIKRKGIFAKLISVKYDVGNDDMSVFDGYIKEIDDICNSLYQRYSK